MRLPPGNFQYDSPTEVTEYEPACTLENRAIPIRVIMAAKAGLANLAGYDSLSAKHPGGLRVEFGNLCLYLELANKLDANRGGHS